MVRVGSFAAVAFAAALFAAHFLHLRADFPNFSPWMDYAKYTDEGWYGSAAVAYFIRGGWYVPGDFNPAVALPVWPFLEWILFHFTGVSLPRQPRVGRQPRDRLGRSRGQLVHQRQPRFVGQGREHRRPGLPFHALFSRARHIPGCSPAGPPSRLRSWDRLPPGAPSTACRSPIP